MADDDSIEELQLPLAWVGLEDLEILFANQFLVQVHGEEITLTVGQASPPPLLGSPEEMREQAERLSMVAVKPVARLAMNRQRLEELIGLLQQTIVNQDTMLAASKKPRKRGGRAK